MQLLRVTEISRGGATVARKAHNLEIAGSNPASATRNKNLKKPPLGGFFKDIVWYHISLEYIVHPSHKGRRRIHGTKGSHGKTRQVSRFF